MSSKDVVDFHAEPVFLGDQKFYKLVNLPKKDLSNSRRSPAASAADQENVVRESRHVSEVLNAL